METGVYLDNAATSHPKPACVREAVLHVMDTVHASAGRGAYSEAQEASAILERTRGALACLLRVQAPERIVFTLNCTDALNLALKGVLRAGDRVVTSDMEHNSVLRPLAALQERLGVRVDRVAARPDGCVEPEALAAALREPARLVVLQHASNVSGSLQPIAQAAHAAHAAGALFLVDAAQTIGSMPLTPESIGIDLLAFPGHKALMGPLGTGGLWVAPHVDLATVREGGTGSRSEEAQQPPFWPDRHEAGSHNLPGLAGLGAAVEWILHEGVERIAAHKQLITQRFLAGLSDIRGVSVHGPLQPECRTAVFALSFANQDPMEVGRLLETRHGVKARAGLHCAPFAHRTLGTFPQGTVRLSAGAFTTLADVDRAIAAIADLTRA
ncbi:MAG: aminotransferase class V-fold PLP-dependent enzyme [Planctomycetes bacterium]|nr:aminotransferase class V-fold PLP-dependent enzyme [Planctomycetota bacterium]